MTGEIDLDEEEPATVELMLQFLYKGAYSDGRSSKPAVSFTTAAPQLARQSTPPPARNIFGTVPAPAQGIFMPSASVSFGELQTPNLFGGLQAAPHPTSPFDNKTVV